MCIVGGRLVGGAGFMPAKAFAQVKRLPFRRHELDASPPTAGAAAAR
jgi:hypothetical protein